MEADRHATGHKLGGYQRQRLDDGTLSIRLHYTADPDKDPATKKGKEWYDQTRKGKSEKDWQQEYEINPNVYDGQPCFPTFDYQQHVVKALKADKSVLHAILVGVDGGFQHPAVSVHQYDGYALRTIGEWIPHNIKVEDLILSIKYQMERFKPYGFPIRYYVGHEGNIPDEHRGQTLVELFDLYGIELNVANIRNIEKGLDLLRTLLDNGKWLISHTCTRLIDALSGGYRYPEENPDKNNPVSKPIKDGLHDDVMDSVRAVATQNFEPDGKYMYNEEVDRRIEEDLMRIHPEQAGKIIRHSILDTPPEPGIASTGY